MLESFLTSIGVSADVLSHLGEARLVASRPGVFWIGLALLPLVVWFLWKRHAWVSDTSPRLRLWLTVTRSVCYLLLWLILSAPTLRIDLVKERRPIVEILVDRSKSMGLPVGRFEDAEANPARLKAAGILKDKEPVSPAAESQLYGMSRAELVKRVLEQSEPEFLAPLRKKFDVRLAWVDDDLKPFDRGRAETKPSSSAEPATAAEVILDALNHPKAPADGDGTRLGDAVAKVLDEAAGSKVAGMILFSDGRNTAGRPPLDAATAAASAVAPVYTVPIGSTSRSPDVSVVELFTAGTVFAGDNARVAVTIESTGFEGRTVPVELLDGDQVVDKRDIILRGAEQQQVELSFRTKDPGVRYLTVRVPSQAEEPESLRSNNQDVTWLRVSDEKLKVLHVDGWPRWDFRFLKNALRRDNGVIGVTGTEPDIILEAEWRRQSPRKPLPTSADELAKYHAVVLGDATPELLTPAFQKALADAVREKGLGLVIAAGPRAMPHRLNQELKDLLPVQLDPAKTGVDALVYKPFRVDLTPDGEAHESLRLYDNPEENGSAWRKLPGFFWMSSVERAAPGANVLAVNPSIENRYGKSPVLAWQYSGRGKVMFVGTDATFLWRRNVGDRFFYKFWGQALRFVARREDADLKKNRLIASPMLARPGDPVQLELFAVKSPGEPSKEPKLTVSVQDEDGERLVEVAADASNPGRYVGGFAARKQGQSTARFTPESGEPAEAQVKVIADPVEFRRPGVHRLTLETMASASGGKVVEFPDLAGIVNELKGETKRSPFKRESSLWDNWLVLALLVGVYSLDVALRRLSGLA
jgi:hypothetical protein